MIRGLPLMSLVIFTGIVSLTKLASSLEPTLYEYALNLADLFSFVVSNSNDDKSIFNILVTRNFLSW